MAVLYNKFAKWIENNVSWTQMTWWKINFNMPTPNLWDDTSGWIFWNWVWPFIYHWEATSFDLTWFNNWWELIVAISTLRWEENEWWWADHTFSQTWKDTLWDVMFTNSSIINLYNPWEWYAAETQTWSNQWIAPWEVNWNWVYTCTVAISWSYVNICINRGY